jgi:hypothetical protein
VSATFAAAIAFRTPIPLAASTYFLQLAIQFAFSVFVVGGAVHLAMKIRAGERPKHPLAVVARWAASCICRDNRPGNIFHTVAALAPLMLSFAAMKQVIQQVNPFAWDHTFMEWDRFLGMGHLPWYYLQPLLGYPIVTSGLNLLYELWFGLMFGTLFWQAFAAKSTVLRSQFLLAFAFAWFIAGNVLATILSSAGPCFYGMAHVPGPNPYIEQIAYLHSVARHWPMDSVWLQDVLWHAYTSGRGDIAGISAMPSMHVTIAVLLALFGWNFDRRLGIILTAYAGIVFIASMTLAWHYAVDGIFGTMLAAVFWVTAGLIAAAWHRYLARGPMKVGTSIGTVLPTEA